MEVKQDYSYGVIPVHKKETGEWEVFILNQISVKTDIYWTFPKGHPEDNETHEESALRELKEEAGLEAKLSTKIFDQFYTFKHDSFLIEKHVVYYLGEVFNTDFVIQPEEVMEAKWCSFAEAYQSLSHDQAKKTLQSVEDYLHNKKI